MSDFIAKFKSLPQPIRIFTFSDIPMMETKKSFVLSGVNSSLSEKIAKEIGLMYVSDLKLGDLPQIIINNIGLNTNTSYAIAYEINKRIFNKFPEYFTDSNDLLNQWSRLKSAPVISEDKAWKKVLELEPWILEIEKEKQEEQKTEELHQQQVQADLINLTVNDALKQFPEIGEQMITSEKITLKNFPESVRPSLKNWLADYTFTIGYDNKDSIKRSNYIFHGNNTLRLLAADREKLAYILKAHDENTPITINKETKQLVFPANTERHSVSNERGYTQTPSVPSDKLHNSVSFSSPQQLPYEKIYPVKSGSPSGIPKVGEAYSTGQAGATESQFNRASTPQPAKQELVSRVKFPPYQQPRPLQPSSNRVSNVVKLEPKPEKPREIPRNTVNLRDLQ